MPTWLVESEHTDWAEGSAVEDDGVIRNVALCGNRSLNGYDIPPSAFGSEQNAQSLYGGKGVFFNHLPPERLNRPLQRDVEDFAGEIFNVRMVNGRPYGDIKTEGAPKGKVLRELAKAGYTNVGLSHCAAYRKNREGTCVEQVLGVATVDAVYMPATTRTFAEQDHTETEPEEVTPVTENNDKVLALLNFASRGRFGQFIRECMESQELATADMAERLQCEASVLSDVVHGARSNPSGERLKSLAEALNVSVEQVTEAINPPEEEHVMEYSDLTVESLRKNRPELLEAILSERAATEQEKAELESARKAVESLQAERDSLAQRVEKFEAEQALIKRRESVLEELAAANLDPANRVVCSEQFVNSLLRTESADERKSLIADRAALLSHSNEQAHVGAAPRHTGGGAEVKPESFMTH